MKIYLPTVEISNLQKRAIQAPLMACLLKEYIEELGYDRAMQVASTAIQRDAAQAGLMMAEKYGGNSFKELRRIVSEVWAGEGALEFTVLEESGQKLSFDVTRCRYAELYERLGLKEFGFCLSCNRDSALIEGFNPRMKLLRTQTIMQGAAACDFRITRD
jgi:hypothetical protein